MTADLGQRAVLNRYSATPGSAHTPRVRSAFHLTTNISTQPSAVSARGGRLQRAEHRDLDTERPGDDAAGLAKQGVQCEVRGEVRDDPDDCGGDAGQRRGEGRAG